MQHLIWDWGKWLLCIHSWSGHLVGYFFLLVERKRPIAMVSGKDTGVGSWSNLTLPSTHASVQRKQVWWPSPTGYFHGTQPGCGHTGPTHLITRFFGCFEILLFFLSFFKTFFFETRTCCIAQVILKTLDPLGLYHHTCLETLSFMG